MKTIEEMGQIAQEAFDLHLGSRKDQFIEAAKAIITALTEDGVSWAPDEQFLETFNQFMTDHDAALRRLAD